MRVGRNALKILTGKLTKRDLYENLGVDGRTILEWILEEKVSVRRIELIRLRIRIIGDLS